MTEDIKYPVYYTDTRIGMLGEAATSAEAADIIRKRRRLDDANDLELNHVAFHWQEKCYYGVWV